MQLLGSHCVCALGAAVPPVLPATRSSEPCQPSSLAPCSEPRHPPPHPSSPAHSLVLLRRGPQNLTGLGKNFPLNPKVLSLSTCNGVHLSKLSTERRGPTQSAGKHKKRGPTQSVGERRGPTQAGKVSNKELSSIKLFSVVIRKFNRYQAYIQCCTLS